MKNMFSLNKKAFDCGGFAFVSRMDKELKLSDKFFGLKVRGLPLDKIALSVLSEWMEKVKSVKKTLEDIQTNKFLLKELSSENIDEVEFNSILKTYYRGLEIIGKNFDEILFGTIDEVKKVYGIDLKKIFSDYTTSFFYGKKCKMAKHGHSKDHRPDKKQVKIGIAITEKGIPIFVSVTEGNKHDSPQFRKDYEKYKGRLPEGSLIVYDKGCDSAENRKIIREDKNHFLTATKMEGDVRRKAERMKKRNMETVLEYKGKKYEKPKRLFGLKKKINGEWFYFYFDERKEQIDKEKRKRKLKRIMDEKKELEKIIATKGYKAIQKKLKKQKKTVNQLNEELVTTTVTIQKRLFEKTNKEIRKDIMSYEKELDGKFVLISSKDMSLEEAAKNYRKKDVSEKMFSDLKSIWNMKPFRVWNDNEVLGCVLLRILAILFVSLIQNEFDELTDKRRETIIDKIKKLTVIADFDKFGKIISLEWMNFDSLLIKILKIPA